MVEEETIVVNLRYFGIGLCKSDEMFSSGKKNVLNFKGFIQNKDLPWTT